jgi:hypothetical protein
VKLFLTTVLLLSSLSAFADKHGHHGHEGHKKGMGAHEHGSLTLEVAVDGKQINIEIEAPAESFLGFEYIAQTEKEKAAYARAETLWTKELLTKLFITDAALGCTLGETSFKQVLEEHADTKEKNKKSGQHSEIQASAVVNCQKDLKGQSATVAFKKEFTKIKKMALDLAGSETKTIQIKKASEVIKL